MPLDPKPEMDDQKYNAISASQLHGDPKKDRFLTIEREQVKSRNSTKNKKEYCSIIRHL
jgi:hypothetical protein